MLRKPRTVLFGAGRMGRALLRGWAEANCFEPAGSVLVIDPNCPEEISELIRQNSARHAETPKPETFTKLQTVILAVKPQKFEELAAVIRPMLPDNVLIISVAAGVSLEQMEALFGAGPHIRAMPNIAAEVGKAITVLCANTMADNTHIETASGFLKAVGQVESVQDERLMDAVTAVSGSGPAYFYLMVEALGAAGQAEGLPEDLAQKLALQTMIGAGALLESRKQDTVAALRAEVTSPGGTTSAALDVMMGNGAFAEMMRNAVSAATRRSSQLRRPG